MFAEKPSRSFLSQPVTITSPILPINWMRSPPAAASCVGKPTKRASRSSICVTCPPRVSDCCGSIVPPEPTARKVTSFGWSLVLAKLTNPLTPGSRFHQSPSRVWAAAAPPTARKGDLKIRLAGAFKISASPRLLRRPNTGSAGQRCHIGIDAHPGTKRSPGLRLRLPWRCPLDLVVTATGHIRCHQPCTAQEQLVGVQ